MFSAGDFVNCVFGQVNGTLIENIKMVSINIELTCETT